MQRSTLALALALPLGLVAGCGKDAPTTDGPPLIHTPDAPPPDGPPEPMPEFRNIVGIDDDTLALSALRRLGAPVLTPDDRCQACHAMTNAHLRQWLTYSNPSLPCITAVDLTSQTSAQAGLACLRALSPTGTIDATTLGYWSSAGRLPWFRWLFKVAYGMTNTPEYQQFVAGVAMSPPTAPQFAFEQWEFDVVAEWVVRGLPRLDFYVPAVGPGNCTQSIDPEVGIRVADLAVTGWRQVNIDNSLSMYGCAGALTPLDCMANQPRAIDRAYSAGWEVGAGQLRLVAELPNYSSAFWTRTSADGRFVAHGWGDAPGGSTIIDLTDDHHIGVDAAYDPAFFPDNSGFVFQGAGRNTCAQSILFGSPTQISMDTDSRCASMGIGLYQHLGRIVGSDYFAISGIFVTDNGGVGEDPSAFFGPTDTAEILPMIYNGLTYVQHTATNVPVPNEGDAVISPSTRMMMTRQGDMNGNHIAFVLHAVNATPNGNTYNIATPQIGRYCRSGGKPSFSFDERWIVYHHVLSPSSTADAMDLGFTGTGDPGFAPYAASGTSNIYLLDLTTGATQRITMMGPGQFAYFPHFRSDGWIYFIEKHANDETVVASDAMLRAE